MKIIDANVPSFVWEFIEDENNKSLTLYGAFAKIGSYNNVCEDGIGAWFKKSGSNQIAFANAFMEYHNVRVGEIELPKFPTDYFEFKHKNESTVSKETIDNWVNELVYKLNNIEKEDFSYIGSGDTMVLGHKVEDGVEIYVSKGYFHASIVDGKVLK